MRFPAVAYALVLLTAQSDGASADWEFTKWRMGPNELTTAVAGQPECAPLEDVPKLPVKMMATRCVFDGMNFDVNFFLDGGLVIVGLKVETDADKSAIDWAIKQYGTPLVDTTLPLRNPRCSERKLTWQVAGSSDKIYADETLCQDKRRGPWRNTSFSIVSEYSRF